MQSKGKRKEETMQQLHEKYEGWEEKEEER
jgi:hypothetical protein